MAEAGQGHGLPSGHLVEGRYRVERVLGEGGFGITYLAFDERLERQVALKEYLPTNSAVREGMAVRALSSVREEFEWGLGRFLDEARTLARFRHPNVVRVVDHFEASGTAYIVMDYEDGEPLDAVLERGTPTEAQLMRVLLPVVDGLKQVHAAGFLHRDVKPANVFVRRSDETPVLLDFGSARQAVGRRSASLSEVVSAGYSPPEQYESDGDQGPWTDVYALSALCYRAIAGEAPVEAPRREGQIRRDRGDPQPSLAESAPAGYSASLLEAVDRGLRVTETERPQTLEEWGAALVGNASPGREAAPPAGSGGRPESVPVGDEDRSEPETRSPAERPPATGARRVWDAALGAAAFVWWLAGPRRGGGAATAWLLRAGGIALVAVAAFAWLVPERSRSPGEAFADGLASGGTGPEMVVVPRGAFRMGCLSDDDQCNDNERPVRDVRIPLTFALSKREVTVGEFKQFVEAAGHSTGDSCRTFNGDEWRDRTGAGWRSPGFEQGDDHPAVCVTWADAKAYAAWLSSETGAEYRLPSEAEWEHAARAGASAKFSWGDRVGINRANCDGCDSQWDGKGTAPVGSFLPNALGLLDMHGNAWEWVDDCWNEDYRGATADGDAWTSGECGQRVMRGGGWANPPTFLRAAHRSAGSSGYLSSHVGFRVARTLRRTPEPSPLEGGGGILAVETVPDGALVLVGDDLAGTTPLQVRTVRAGTHTVTLRHPDYETVEFGGGLGLGASRGVTFADGHVHRIERELVRGTGALTVITEPAGAWVERDGDRLAVGTPVTLEGLPAGTLALTLGADGHRPARVEARVPKDGVGLLEVALEGVAYGTLTLELAPPDAKVTLPDIPPRYSAGMRLPEGRHRVVVSRQGYRRSTRTVRVAGDTLARIELEVDPQPFTVVASPPMATIGFVGRSDNYVPGMRLPPGEYRVRVAAEGYDSREESVRHGVAPTRREIALAMSPGVAFRDCADCPEMVVVPTGRFDMGCGTENCDDDERPVHTVRIGSGFALGRYEVTVGEFRRFVDATGYRTDAEKRASGCWTLENLGRNTWGWSAGRSWRNLEYTVRERQPVTCVSWNDAKAYAAWLSEHTGGGYRLPTEAEWEYAARAGTRTRYHFGDAAEQLCDHANVTDRTRLPNGGAG